MDKHLYLLRPFSLREGDGPAYRQLAQFLEELKKSGLLASGDRLPAERELSLATGLSRTTVAAAYARLVTEGLAETRIGTGTFLSGSALSQDPSMDVPPPWAHPPAVALDQVLSLSSGPFDLDDSVISFATGAPAPELTPTDFPQAVADGLASHGGILPPHSAPAGLPELREALSLWMAEDTCRPSTEDLLVTTGSQQALYLVARVYLRPGDAVLVQQPGFFGALQLFKSLGAYMVELDLTMTSDALTQRLQHHQPKLMYVNSTFQNPSGIVLDVAQRHKLLEVAHRLNIPIIDDDPYRELWFDVLPPPRLRDLAKLPGDPLIITLGTVSKLLTPAIRLGWVTAPTVLMEKLVRLKQVSDLNTSLISQAVVLYYLKQNRLKQHAVVMRQEYRRRRDLLVHALKKHLPEAELTLPSGGFYVWCCRPGMDSLALFPQAISQGVSFVPGPSFYAAGDGSEWLRLSFASPPAELIEEGVKRLSRAMKELEQS